MLERSRSRILRSLLLVGIGAVAACSSPPSGDGNVATSSTSDALTAVPAVVPAWAKPENYAGRVAPGTNMALQVHLQMHDMAGAQAELAALSDPDNARYGQFLSDEDFATKYAPTQDDANVVRAHLEKSGLRVTFVPENQAFLTVEGTSEQVEHAFSTRLGTYMVEGVAKVAQMETAKLPVSVNAHVSAVLGLATPPKMKPQLVRKSDIKRKSGAKPSDTVPPNTCSKFFGDVNDTEDPAFGNFPSPMPYVGCGFKPAQVRQAYGFEASIRKGNDGKGQKIAIVDAYTSPTLVKDAQTYFANEDADYPLATSQITLYQGPGTASDPDPGWYGEQSLDVESIHSIAPGAQIVYVGAQSATDVDLIGAVNMIVTKKLATVISNSYGSVEGYGNALAPWQALAIQAGLKGIGLYFASGDAGDNSQQVGFASPNFPASLAEVTAVGGTSLALDASGARVFELGWETGVSFLDPAVPTTDADGGILDAGTPTWDPAAPGFWYFGGGGGMSGTYFQPSWQKGVVPPSISTNIGTAVRVIPDVSMLADPMTGLLIGQSDPTTGVYGESAYGGTSLATPLYTATVALAQQKAGRKFGFANPLFYKAAKKGAFTDVAPSTPYAVAVPGGIATTFDYKGADSSLATAPGFDNVTGLGVPNGAKFFSYVK